MTETGIEKTEKVVTQSTKAKILGTMERFPPFISWKIKGDQILSALKASGPLLGKTERNQSSVNGKANTETIIAGREDEFALTRTVGVLIRTAREHRNGNTTNY